MIEPGSVVGHIRIDRVIGRGAMGVVFAGTHLELEQPVAVKVLIDECANEPVTVARFLREARAAARLRTEHVCRVFDVGRYGNDAPYMVMEMLAGEDLRQMMEREDIPVPTCVDFIAQACIALGEAHAAGIVHRDLKPANLFCTRGADGRVIIKVLDFGIAKAATAAEAKLTATASMIGTPAYTSPEQIRSARDVDLRTDIWALGATLYHMTTGRLPFMAEKLADMAIRVMTAPMDPLPELDPGLAAVIARCLEKEPEARYASVAELAHALAPYGLSAGAVAPGTERNAQLAAPPTSVIAAARTSGQVAAPTPPMQQAPAPQSTGVMTSAGSKRGLAIGVGVLGLGGVIGLVVALAVRHGEKPAAPAPTSSPAVATSPMPPAPAATPSGAPGAQTTAATASGPGSAAGTAHKKSTWKAVAHNGPADPESRKIYLANLVASEKVLVDFAGQPEAVEAAHKQAAMNACLLQDGDKAAEHFGALTVDSDRENIEQLCLGYGLSLH